MTSIALASQPTLDGLSADDASITWRRWAVALVLLGIAWRCTRYLLRFPIWGDEAANTLNLIEQDYLGILGPLPHQQVAPVLFWWGELWAISNLGTSELACRLLPLLAGVGGLLLVWRLAHLTLPPLACTLAIGMLAVAYGPVSMATLIKPYSLDLFMSAALLVLAVQFLRQPDRLRWLAGLTFMVPVALFGSYPAVFVAGLISIALVPAVWRQSGCKTLALFTLYNVLLVASFAGNLAVGQTQIDPSDTVFHDFIREYWAHGFPPVAPLAFLKWLVLTHTGRLMAYPVGGSDGLSALTFMLFLAGFWQLWRQRKRALLVLYIGPFALGFFAAALHRYPYGGCWRISQHLAPAICLVAGLGTALAIQQLRRTAARQRCITGVCSLLALIGLAGTGRDIVRPYHGDTDLWMRSVLQQIAERAAPDDRVLLCNEGHTDVVFQWYLYRYFGSEHRAACPGGDGLLGARGQVWCLQCGFDFQPRKLAAESTNSVTPAWRLGPSSAAPWLQTAMRSLALQGTWVITDCFASTFVPARLKDPIARCDVYRLAISLP